MARQTKHKGLFISFEGGEGSGKSTQTQILVKWLKQHRIPTIYSREPGGTPVGERIRKLLLDPKIKQMAPLTELLLYASDRAQHVAEVIRPAIEQGKVVISDRFEDSTNVYQGIGRDLGLKNAQALNHIATGGLHPELVLLLDLPVDKARGRIKGRTLDRLELEKKPFHQQVRRGFLKLARQAPKRYKVLNAARSEEVVAAEVQKLVKALLKRRKLWK